MIEVLVAAGVAAIAIAGAFAFASYQITTYRTQNNISSMNTSSNVVFESMARDIRNAAFGSSFWVGAMNDAFGSSLALDNRGIPALRPMNSAATTNANVMPQTDAITVLRVESDATYIPDITAGGRAIPGEFAATEQFMLADPAVLQSCANRSIDGDGDEDGIVLISDAANRQEPASFLLAINPIAGVTRGTPGLVSFQSVFGLNPANTNRVNENNPNQGRIVPFAGPGSLVVCVRPVTYWIDAQARLRMWRASTQSPGNAATIASGGTNAFGTLPIDPARDVVLAEGVEDLQIAYLMSAAAPAAPNQWLFSVPTLGIAVGNEAVLAEIRAVRISAVVRTPGVEDAARPQLLPANLEDRAVPANRVAGCTDPSSCVDPRYTRRVMRFQTEIRSMRLFDLMSSTERNTNDIRSFLP